MTFMTAGSSVAMNLNSSNVYNYSKNNVGRKAFLEMVNLSAGLNYMTPRLFDSYYYNVVDTSMRQAFMDKNSLYDKSIKASMQNHTCVFFSVLGGQVGSLSQTFQNRQWAKQRDLEFLSKLLVMRFGNLNTNFLKFVGVGLNMNVSYITIMRNANEFFKYIYPREFYAPIDGHGINKNSKISNILNLSDFGHIGYKTGVNFFQFFSAIAPHFQYFQQLNAIIPPVCQQKWIFTHIWIYVPFTDLKLFTFYSLTFNMIKNVESANPNPKIEKLLKDIILRNYSKAYKILK